MKIRTFSSKNLLKRNTYDIIEYMYMKGIPKSCGKFDSTN